MPSVSPSAPSAPPLVNSRRGDSEAGASFEVAPEESQGAERGPSAFPVGKRAAVPEIKDKAAGDRAAVLQTRMTRSTASKEHKSVLTSLTKVLEEQNCAINNTDLKSLLTWVSAHVSDANTSNIYTVGTWDSLSVELWDCAMRGDPAAQKLLPAWRVMFEALKNHTQKGDPTAPVTPSASLPVETKTNSEPENPFDPGPIDPEKEPSVFGASLF